MQHRSQPIVAARAGRDRASMRDRPHDRRRQPAAGILLPPHDFRNRSWWLENQLRRHGDGRLQTAVPGTFIRENAVDACRSFPIERVSYELNSDMDAPDDQYDLRQFNLT